ncbi:MAG: FAD:protein FMN transferase [Tannerellaceae bacterium]|jgi:thiamine biosynthesis lipoprotein|nr:FAD:protein FMN transferase [Tannerellaceae bacterium]
MKQTISLVTLAILAILAGCAAPGTYYEESGSVFRTIYRIKYQSPRLLTEQIEAELQAFNLSLNPFNPNSIISKVNRNEPVEVDPWFAEVFRKAEEVSARSGGAFDATVAPLINLWGFGFSRMDSITPRMIDSIRTFVGYRKIRLEGTTVVKDDPRVILNFSAIAKGYACDVIARLLEREGVTNYMVEIGGEVAMRGINPNGECWRIGINKPQDDIEKPQDDIEGNIPELEDTVQPCKACGIATSGDYRNFYVRDGKKYAHTINPATGYPAAQNILSATVLAADCMTADAYATAFMVMGIERAVETARTIDGIDYFFIYTDSDGNRLVSFSDGMQPYLLNR